MIVDGDMIRISVIVLVSDSLNDTECSPVTFGKPTAEAFSRSGKNRIVMGITLAEFICLGAHMAYNSQTKLLGIFAFTMMFSSERDKTLRETDKPDAKRTLIDDTFNSVVRSKFFRTLPKSSHHKRELLCKSSLLELESVIKLLCSQFEDIVETFEEAFDTLVFILDTHTFNSKTDNIDSRERKISSSY